MSLCIINKSVCRANKTSKLKCLSPHILVVLLCWKQGCAVGRKGVDYPWGSPFGAEGEGRPQTMGLYYLFVLLIYASCCLLLGSQQLFCCGHNLTAGAEYLVLLGGSATPAHPWHSLGVFAGCTGFSSTPAVLCLCRGSHQFRLRLGCPELDVTQYHTPGAAGTRGNKDVSQLSIPREQEAFWGNTSSVDGTWLEHRVLPQLGGE